LVFGLALSIAFLGIGRIEFFTGGSVSAWSISRTTFFFWLALKVLLLIRGGWTATGLSRLKTLTPLLFFFSAVTLSLLPTFRQAGDYRYFLFGCAHAVMVADLFAGVSQKRWLPLLCGVLPLILVVRGFIDDPSVFNLVLAHRFEFPLDHANTAGYVFAMSIPLGLAAALAWSPVWRTVGGLSCASQVLALLLTYSRGAWLGLAGALCFFLASARKWQYLMALGILAAGCLLAFPSIKDRLVSLTSPSDDESLTERLYLSNAALDLGLDYPVLGVGYGRGRLKEGLRPRLQDTPLRDRPILHSHNVYVELFAGTGLSGLLSFIWVSAGSLLRVALTARKREGQPQLLGFALAASWVGVLVAGIGDIPFYHHETRIFFFTLVAAAHIYYSSAGDSPSL
jgi:O-antigen ligase